MIVMQAIAVYLLVMCPVQLNVNALAIESEQTATNFTRLILSKVFRELDANKNFLLAPQQIQQLYKRLQTNDFYAEFDNDDIGTVSLAEIMNPIKVCNSFLQRRAKSENGTNLENALIINSVTLRTRWTRNFQKRDTHKYFFHAKPHRLIQLFAMNKDAYYPYAVLPELDATALELSLEGHHVKMLILLPNRLNGLAAMIHSLSARLELIDELLSLDNAVADSKKNFVDTVNENVLEADNTNTLQGRMNRGARLQSTLLRITMPKFNLIHSVLLDDYFASEIFPTPLSLKHQVYQETLIKVNEHGIGDMERTTVLFWNAYSSVRVTPKLFDMNHPFLFFIYDSAGLQFIGQLAHIGQ